MAEETYSAILESSRERLQTALRVVNQELFKEFESLKEYNAPAPPAPEPVVNNAQTAMLLAASRQLASGKTQVEILKALVNQSAQLVPRTLLFIRKGGNFHGWAGEGFSLEFSNGPMKKICWAADHFPELTRVTQTRQPLIANFSDLSDISEAISGFDGFVPFKSSFYPLIVKEKVAAILYLDSGSETSLENEDAAELLCHMAGLELTNLALIGRKAREEAAKAASAPAPPTQPQQPPKESAAAPRIISPVHPEPVPDFHPGNVVQSHPTPKLDTSATFDDFNPDPVPEPAAPTPFAPAAQDEDPGIKKAKRVARVLVSDLKLYNEAAVQAAQNSGDLYKRLKEDIDRSYQHYNERVAGLVPGGTNYFKEELIRQLGDGNPAEIGPLPF